MRHRRAYQAAIDLGGHFELTCYRKPKLLEAFENNLRL
jgi:hypothetical protein